MKKVDNVDLFFSSGVAYGIRTHDPQNHKLML